MLRWGFQWYMLLRYPCFCGEPHATHWVTKLCLERPLSSVCHLWCICGEWVSAHSSPGEVIWHSFVPLSLHAETPKLSLLYVIALLTTCFLTSFSRSPLTSYNFLEWHRALKWLRSSPSLSHISPSLVLFLYFTSLIKLLSPPRILLYQVILCSPSIFPGMLIWGCCAG